MKRLIIFTLLLFGFFVNAQVNVPATTPIVKSIVHVAQSTPISNPKVNERYLSTDGNYYKWDGSTWLLDNSSGNDFPTAATLTGNILTITIPNQDDVNVDLGQFMDDTDDQTITDFSLTGSILSITLSGGNTVTQDLSSIVGGGAVDSVNGLTGTVTIDTDNIPEGSNLYYTDARVSANSDVAASKAKTDNIPADQNAVNSNIESRTAANDAKVSADGSIDTHSDVEPSGVSNGQVLKWNDTNSRWEPGNDDVGGAGSDGNSYVTSVTLLGNDVTFSFNDRPDITLDVSALYDNTDGQTITDLSLNGSNILSITLSGGNTDTVDLSALASGGASQTAAATTYADTYSLSITEVQSAIDTSFVNIAKINNKPAEIDLSAAQSMTQINRIAYKGAFVTDVVNGPDEFYMVSNAANPDNETNVTTGFQTTGSYVMTSTNEESSSGLYSIKYVQNAAGTFVAANNDVVTLATGTYKLKLDQKSPNGTEHRIRMKIDNANDTDTGGFIATGGWDALEVTFTVTAATSDVFFQFYISNSVDNNGVSTYLDNVRYELQGSGGVPETVVVGHIDTNGDIISLEESGGSGSTTDINKPISRNKTTTTITVSDSDIYDSATDRKAEIKFGIDNVTMVMDSTVGSIDDKLSIYSNLYDGGVLKRDPLTPFNIYYKDGTTLKKADSIIFSGMDVAHLKKVRDTAWTAWGDATFVEYIEPIAGDAIGLLDNLVFDVNAENETDLASISTTQNDGSSSIDLTFSGANATISTVSGYKQFDMNGTAYGILTGSGSDNDFEEDGSSDFSLGIVLEGASSFTNIIGATNNTDNFNGYGIRSNGSTAIKTFAGGVQQVSNIVIGGFTGRKVLIITYDASADELKTYSDGVLLDTLTAGSTFISGTDFAIFGRASGTNITTGAFLRAFKTTDIITQAEVTAIQGIY